MNSIVIWGIGGHAREAAQLVSDIEARHPGTWSLKGFLVDKGAATQHPRALPAPVLGGLEWWAANPGVWAVVAVGEPQLRLQIAQRMEQARPGSQFATLVHPMAWVASTAQIGEGSLVFAQSCVSDHVRVGSHASINLACTISHDSVLGDFVSLGPGVNLCGGVSVEDVCELGAGSTVIPNVKIGAGVKVGAGACRCNRRVGAGRDCCWCAGKGEVIYFPHEFNSQSTAGL
jgi:sugar O-acyltransferase (sialic acid O-acetyltransferase NeuD family)